MKWLTSIKAWLQKTFKLLQKDAKIVIPIGIKIVDSIKKFASSPYADFLTSVIPGELDDQIKLTLRTVLPKILIGLRKWEGIVNIEDESVKLKVIASELHLLSKSERDNLKTQIAAEIAQALSPGLEIYDAKIAVLTAYHHPEVLGYEKTS
jgi:hypothetical protein